MSDILTISMFREPLRLTVDWDLFPPYFLLSSGTTNNIGLSLLHVKPYICSVVENCGVAACSVLKNRSSDRLHSTLHFVGSPAIDPPSVK